ncbi:hypothetical protein ElyMa_006445200 [Elysia marginata]|uniref:Uncharacterized protein n=1 Tax=Elysia marginata TaxID=1093978 RepID=A0AAV4HX00_9GAST|nr:hypothetical protein ElyMa_006445200 [Elysia marginata]
MPRFSEVDRHHALGLLQAGLPISEVSLRMNVRRFLDSDNVYMRRIRITDTNVIYGPRNMPHGIASNGEVSYSVTNLDSALIMLMAVYMYGEEVVKDTQQIALGNMTDGVEHL